MLIIKNTAYIMYFAIDKKYRNKGYGSYILDDLVKKYDNVILSIEKTKNEISLRRKRFYLRNGFYETNKYTIQAKVQYELKGNLLIGLNKESKSMSLLKMKTLSHTARVQQNIILDNIYHSSYNKNILI